MAKSAVRLISIDQIAPESVKWLWPRRIPLGKITILQGDPGLGKSTLALDVASRATRNLPMPDESVSDLDEPASVLLLSAEDGPADTIRPRLDATEAEQTRIHIPQGEQQYLIPRDMPALREAVLSLGAKLIVIDPLPSFLDGTLNTWNNHHVRRALSPLAKIAEDTGAAFLVVDHLNKRGGVSAMQRGGGSIGFNAVARSVLIVGKNPHAAGTMCLASVKSNLGPPPASLGYRTTEAFNGASKLEWLGECSCDADELVASPSQPQSSGKLEVAKQFLLNRLAETSVLSRVLESEAQSNGISVTTLGRAKRELRVISRPIGKAGEWTLSLPVTIKPVA